VVRRMVDANKHAGREFARVYQAMTNLVQHTLRLFTFSLKSFFVIFTFPNLFRNL